MPAHLEPTLVSNLQTAAREAGLKIVSVETGADFNGHPTTRFRLGESMEAPAERTLLLELSEAFDFHKPELLPEMTSHLREAAMRLRNPRPDAYVTLAGLPVSFSHFAWPFHRSILGRRHVYRPRHGASGRRNGIVAACAGFGQHDGNVC